MRIEWILSSIVSLAVPSAALAHGGLHERIAAVTRLIEEDPSDARLLLQRAELYRSHEQWTMALWDLERAARQSPELTEVFMVRGRIESDLGHYERARAALNSLVELQPTHAEALRLRARCSSRLNEHESAVEDYARAIRCTDPPDPDLYVECVRSAAALGPDSVDARLRILDSGLQALGVIPALQSFAIDLEVGRGRFDQALERLETLARQSVRQESWLARRGDILRAAGREQEAVEAYAAALAAIAHLPPRLRRTEAIIELEAALRRSSIERDASECHEKKQTPGSDP